MKFRNKSSPNPSLPVLSGDKDFDHPTGNVTNVYGTANAEALSLIKVNELRKFRAIWYIWSKRT